RTLRQRGDEAKGFRRLVAPELAQTVRAKLVFGARRIRLQHDASENVVPVFGVADADRRRLEHRRVPQQRLVDLARRDVLATLDDELLQTAGDELKAVAIAIP